MSARPAALLGVEGGRLSVGCAADVVVFDPDKEIGGRKPLPLPRQRTRRLTASATLVKSS